MDLLKTYCFCISYLCSRCITFQVHVIHTKLNDIGKSGWCNKPSIELLRWDETGSRRGGNGTILSDLPQGNDMIAGLLITLHLVDRRCTCWAPIGDIAARIINYIARKRRSACKQFVLQGFVHPRNLPDSEHARCFGRAPVRDALAGLLDVNCGDLESHRRRQGISTGDWLISSYCVPDWSFSMLSHPHRFITRGIPGMTSPVWSIYSNTNQNVFPLFFI